MAFEIWIRRQCNASDNDTILNNDLNQTVYHDASTQMGAVSSRLNNFCQYILSQLANDAHSCGDRQPSPTASLVLARTQEIVRFVSIIENLLLNCLLQRMANNQWPAQGMRKMKPNPRCLYIYVTTMFLHALYCNTKFPFTRASVNDKLLFQYSSFILQFKPKR